MNRLRQWLCGGLEARITALEAAHGNAIDQLRETKTALAETISELNALRNAQSETTPRNAVSHVRRYPNWSATRAALEGHPIPGSSQPIPLERKK